MKSYADERDFINDGDDLAQTARMNDGEVIQRAAAFRQRGTAKAGSEPISSKVDVSAVGEPEELIDPREELTPEGEAKVKENRNGGKRAIRFS